MSPPLKSFEGPDVEVLLDRIRREVGPDAKINGAEKIRVGGVLGFFAKEQYRVLVECPEVSGVLRPIEGSRSRQPAHARPAKRGRHKGEGRHLAPPAGAVVLRDAEPTAQVPVVAHVAFDAGTDPFSALADATDDVTDIAGLSRATAALVPAGASTLEPTTVVPVVGGDLEPSPASAPESFDAVLCRIATTLDSDLPTWPAADGPGPAPGTGGGLPPAPQGATATDPGTTYAGTATAPGAGGGWSGVPAPSARSIAAEAAHFLAGAQPRPAPDDLLGALRHAGVDEELVRTVDDAVAAGADAEAVLVEVFGRMPVAPPLPRRPGSLLVVAGPRSRAQALAAALAIEVGADPGDVPVASLDPEAGTAAGDRLVVRGAEEAGELAPGWRRSKVAVVAVDAPLAGTHRPWALHLIAALRPTMVWGVVDATCKAEDMRAWAEDIGGIDAVALYDVDATVSPTAALATGIPVARLDGRPASAARWTATVVDRIHRCT
ncbi:MAG TPA: hypothetical protein VMB72_09900 [Acidimicrobiales bacterium]|nr:hypothetical protein [Acidimicrobiales bacterium]